MNPILEKEVLHIGRAMPSSMGQFPSPLLAAYWATRIAHLLGMPDVTPQQRERLLAMAEQLHDRAAAALTRETMVFSKALSRLIKGRAAATCGLQDDCPGH